jgi:hypothetical protein
MSEKKCRYCAMMIPKEAKICPHCRKRQGLSWPVKILLTLIGLALLPSFIRGITEYEKAKSTTSSTTSHDLSSKQEALSSVKLKYNWGKAGFDNVMEANFTIENQSKYDIKDLEIKCTHFAKSGTVIDSNTRTIYDIVKAKSKKKFDKFNMGFIHSQANSSICEITDLKVN